MKKILMKYIKMVNKCHKKSKNRFEKKYVKGTKILRTKRKKKKKSPR